MVRPTLLIRCEAVDRLAELVQIAQRRPDRGLWGRRSQRAAGFRPPPWPPAADTGDADRAVPYSPRRPNSPPRALLVCLRYTRDRPVAVPEAGALRDGYPTPSGRHSPTR